MTDKLSFYVNGKKVEVDNVDPVMNLSTFLRNNLGLTGTKNGCGRGVCGACTVMIASYDPHAKKINNFSVNSCLYPLANVEHCAITTVEGLGSTSKGLHPIQERFFKGHSSQCGFCTPGFIMSIYAMLRNNPKITSEELMQGLDGNLCRCTGYRSIVDSMSTFGSDCPCKNNNSKENSNGTITRCCSGLDKEEERVPPEQSKLEEGEELIFPSALQLNPRKSKHIIGDRTEVYLPISLKEFLELKHKFPKAIILGANSTRIFEKTGKGSIVISTFQVEELRKVEFSKEGDLIVGGGSNFGEVLNLLEKHGKHTLFGALKSIFLMIGSTQVRNSSTLAGNIILNDYNSDLIPLLMCGNAKVILSSHEGNREVDVMSFIKGPGAKNVDLKEGELITAIKIPESTNEEYVASYKVNTRETTSRSVVGSTFKVRLDNGTVADIRLAYCGVSQTVKRALTTEKGLIGEKWEHDIVEKALNLLSQDFFKDIENLGENVEYRKSLVQSLFFKFFHSSFSTFKGEQDIFETREFPVVPKGTQTWEEGIKNNKIVGKSYTHSSGKFHTTGEAKYVGDIELPKGGLEAAVVYSTVAHGKILNIDTSEALKCEGVVAFFSSKDFASNPISPLTKRHLLPSDTVSYYGDPIGIVVADTHENALRGAFKVKIQYEELPSVLDLDEAIKTNNLAEKFFFPVIENLDNGKVDEEFLNSNDNEIFEGQYELGGAKHHYMETHSVLVLPQEGDELVIYAASQDVKAEQENASAATGIARHKITVKTKRVGGSFGGKTGSGCYAVVAVASKKLRKPVRLVVPRSVDSLITSRRGIFRAKYKVAVSKKDHKVVAVDWDIQVDGGCSGFAPFLTNELLVHLDNCYNFPNFRCNSKVYKTNRSMTWPMRGAGCPQGSAMVEFMFQDIAMKLNIDATEFREKHLYQNGNHFVNHQLVENCEPLHQGWKLLKEGQNFKELCQQVDIFNSKNRYKKRGISLTPIRYSIIPAAFSFMMQGSALVHVNQDGTVMLSHDGIELGQGINVKMAQVCAEVFDISVDDVYIPHVSTEQTTGMIGMGGSKDTERVGGAVKLACEQIKERLDELKKTINKPEASFKELCAIAFLHRVSLAAYGHFSAKPEYELMKVHGFTYFTWASCLSLVEIDVLTGRFDILDCHTVQDVGRSINPSIDIGQIEGGFMMGLSWLTQEDLCFSPKNGSIQAQPEDYEIAGPQNLPQNFHITILPNSDNPKSVHSLKGVGEPPHSLPISVVCALKHAISFARKEIQLEPVEEFFQTPLNRERIQLLCGNQTNLSNKSEKK